MGCKLSQPTPWLLVVALLLICFSTPASGFSAADQGQQAEKVDENKTAAQAPRSGSTSDGKTSNQDSAESAASPADPPRINIGDEAGGTKPAIGRPFDFGSVASARTTGGAASQAQPGAGKGRPASFSIYFMSEYRRDEIKYTGKPTLALQFPSPVPPFSVPDAPIHFVPEAFEPNDEQFISYLSATFKDIGLGRLRLDTQVSVRYSADLDRTTAASPFLGIRDAFVGRRIFEPLTFFGDLRGLAPERSSTKVSLRIGRQYVYGATPLRVDGGTLSIKHPRFSLDVFGGRRATFYSDPGERAVAGENFVFSPTEHTTIRYDFAHYIDNVHTIGVRHVLGESWMLNGSLFLIDTDPVDLNVGATYLSPGAKTRLTMNFLEKLTSKDFIYDQTYRAFARNPENQIRFRFFPLPPTGQAFDARGRLNLGLVNPYTQFNIDGYRNLTSKVGIGGTVCVRKVNSRKNEGPFDNSFQEFRANADYYPSPAFDVGTEYRYRHLSRADAEDAKFFDDISLEGEKTFHEVFANASYHLMDGRLTVEGGLFYRRFDTQSRLISLKGMDAISYNAGLKLRVARDYKLALEYGFDRELSFLNPDIDYTQGFRVRFEWRFSR